MGKTLLTITVTRERSECVARAAEVPTVSGHSQEPLHALSALLSKLRELDLPLPPSPKHLARLRPKNFEDLDPEERWDIDRKLGILDWDGKD